MKVHPKIAHGIMLLLVCLGVGACNLMSSYSYTLRCPPIGAESK